MFLILISKTNTMKTKINTINIFKITIKIVFKIKLKMVIRKMIITMIKMTKASINMIVSKMFKTIIKRIKKIQTNLMNQKIKMIKVLKMIYSHKISKGVSIGVINLLINKYNKRSLFLIIQAISKQITIKKMT